MSRRESSRGSGGEDRPSRIGSLIDPLLKKLGIVEEVARQEALVRWDEIVGDQIARVTHAAAVANGVLFVEVASSAWLNELDLMKHDILRRLNAGQGSARVERIIFRLAEKGRANPPPG